MRTDIATAGQQIDVHLPTADGKHIVLSRYTEPKTPLPCCSTSWDLPCRHGRTPCRAIVAGFQAIERSITKASPTEHGGFAPSRPTGGSKRRGKWNKL